MSRAIITTGSKQYNVALGSTIETELLRQKEGDTVAFSTLLVADDDNKKIEIGKPLLTKKVEGKIIKHFRDDKVHVIKFKSKVRYRRHRGHRQNLSLVKITSI